MTSATRLRHLRIDTQLVPILPPASDDALRIPPWPRKRVAQVERRPMMSRGTWAKFLAVHVLEASNGR